MQKLSSLEIDFHDNPALIQDRADDLPEFVKGAEAVSRNEIDPAKCALVLAVEGRTIPKFALHNKAHVWLANEVFPKTAHRLPERARKVAAYFIKRACHEYKIPANEVVLREADFAEKVADNVIDVAGYQDQSALDYDKYRIGWRGQFPASLLAEKLQEFVRRDAVDVVSTQEMGEELASRIYAYAMQEGYSLPPLDTLGGMVSSALPAGFPGKSEVKSFFVDRIATIEDSEKVKRASLDMALHNYKAGSFGVVTKTASGKVQGAFPLHSDEMVKQAVEFFRENREMMAPKYRHELASSIVKNAAATGTFIKDATVRSYASDQYSPNLEGNLEARRQLVKNGADKDAERVLNELERIQGRLTPRQFAQSLEAFDKQAGLDRHWDKSIKDPWLSTFEYVKKASWSWSSGDQEVTESQLVEFVSKHADSLSGYVNQNIITELKRHPVEIFDSLPRPEKEIIASKIEEAGL